MRWLNVCCAAALVTAACGDNAKPVDDDLSLDDFLPEVPAPTGDAQSVFAGPITSADDLIPGDAAHGMIGDFFMRNNRARFVIQSEARVPGIVPHGGNLVDAAALDADGNDVTEDHFGELSAIYQVARTCEHTDIEIVRDGAGGGAAVIRARGTSSINGMINFKGLGVFPIPEEIDPSFGDDIACATTYVLEPDASRLDVYWTYFNAGEHQVEGPFGTFSDTGGEVEVFAPTRGFERLGLEAITSLGDPAPVDYVVYQGPSVAYGIIPRYDEPAPSSQFSISGISILLYGSDSLLGILEEDLWFFDVAPQAGVTHRLSVVVGADASDVEGEFLTLAGATPQEISGTVAMAGGGPAAGARVGVYLDAEGDGVIGEDDAVYTYADPAPDGSFRAFVADGDYLVRAEIKDSSRSAPVAASAGDTGVAVELPNPATFDYSIVDDETGALIPGRLTVVGVHPAKPDGSLFETADRIAGVVRIIPAARGTTVDIGDGTDPKLVLPAGGDYRVFASRGTEWSVASERVQPTSGETGTLEFRLRRVVPTPGYLATEFHQHSIGSMDSPVPRHTRLFTFAAEGVEFFASTDHDFVTNFQPIVEALGLDHLMRAVPGLEVTPFDYGHFQVYPLEVSTADPSGGAIDWARGQGGFAMIPRDIFDRARNQGAQVVQINHPRATAADFADIMRFFDRVGLVFDYDARVIAGDPNVAPVPYDWMRLPGEGVWDDSFNAIEVWNGFDMKDSNDDGVREIAPLDTVMRDWFNFLSFGMETAPVGNSDSHTVVKDPVGMPRTYIRVPDDSSAALQTSAVETDVMDALTGRTPRDIVVTNGPFIDVQVFGFDGSPLGQVVDPVDGTVTVDITVRTPMWAPIDTVELFVNATPDVTEKVESWLLPVACATERPLESLAETDPCVLAARAPVELTVEKIEVAPGFQRLEARIKLDIEATEIAAYNRAGASGGDAWLVIRARGSRAAFPLLAVDAIDDDTLPAILDGDPTGLDAALTNVGVPATAFTMPIYVDFDGGGYRAPFAP